VRPRPKKFVRLRFADIQALGAVGLDGAVPVAPAPLLSAPAPSPRCPSTLTLVYTTGAVAVILLSLRSVHSLSFTGTTIFTEHPQ
jgi:hypothetical protein